MTTPGASPALPEGRPDAEDEADALENALVEYDEKGELFGTSGAGAYFLASFLVDRGWRAAVPEGRADGRVREAWATGFHACDEYRVALSLWSRDTSQPLPSKPTNPHAGGDAIACDRCGGQPTHLTSGGFRLCSDHVQDVPGAQRFAFAAPVVAVPEAGEADPTLPLQEAITAGWHRPCSTCGHKGQDHDHEGCCWGAPDAPTGCHCLEYAAPVVGEREEKP